VILEILATKCAEMKRLKLLITFVLVPGLLLFAQEKPFSINHGPYLQYLTANEVTIVWTTTGDAVSWVEFYADDGSHFYQTERPKHFAASDGLKVIGKIHKVTLTNLKPGTRYLYRVYSKEVLDKNYNNPLFGRTAATDVYRRQPLSFKTIELNKEKTFCVVLADMLSNSSKIAGLLADVKWDETDFVVSNGSNPVFGRTDATDVYRRQPLSFRTIELNKEKTFCVVLADMHNNSSKIAGLLADVKWDETDFVVSNGDFIGTFNREEDFFSGGLDTCVSIFATGKPIYFVRGNHETRGNSAWELKNYLHSPNNEYFYTFVSGKTLFIVLDGGEGKPDSDIEYNELVDFDPYRSKVADWLRNVTESDEFKSSEHKIVFSHIPPFFLGRSAWHGDTEVREKYVPVLNKAGIDLMISGHTHRYAFIDRKSGENEFPIIVLNNNCRMDLLIDSNGISATITDLERKVLLKQKIE